jgi:RNA polymerase sigma-70 factor (ECF subfamily)
MPSIILPDRLKLLRGSAVEHELIEKSKGGDHAAFAELMQRNSPIALRAIRRLMYNHADAEDVLQDTLLKAFAKLESFNERSAFSTWLTRIAINNALIVLRRARYRREISLNTETGESNDHIVYPALISGGDPEKTYMRTRSVTIVRDAIRKLPGPLRQPAEWHCLEERTHRDIASSLGISLACSKSRSLRAKSRLFRMLKVTEGGVAKQMSAR